MKGARHRKRKTIGSRVYGESKDVKLIAPESGTAVTTGNGEMPVIGDNLPARRRVSSGVVTSSTGTVVNDTASYA